MPLYLCRWPNGDSSVVLAKNKEDAIFQLDEFGEAEERFLTPLPKFLVDFSLLDDGDFGVVFSEDTAEEIMTQYPLLRAMMETDVSEPDEEKVKEAVRQERLRVLPTEEVEGTKH